MENANDQFKLQLLLVLHLTARPWGWHAFSRPVIKRRRLESMQSRVSFDTNLRIALRSKWVKMAEDGKKKTLLVSTKFSDVAQTNLNVKKLNLFSTCFLAFFPDLSLMYKYPVANPMTELVLVTQLFQGGAPVSTPFSTFNNSSEASRNGLDNSPIRGLMRCQTM